MIEGNGLGATPKTGTISPPKEQEMYRVVEQGDNVAKGHVEVTELIAYDPIGKKIGDDGKVMTDVKGREILIEKSRGPYFCQDREDVLFFTQNNRSSRIESFSIQVLKSTAKKYIDNPENMKQFGKGGK